MTIALQTLGTYSNIPFDQEYVVVATGCGDNTHFLARDIGTSDDRIASDQMGSFSTGPAGGLSIYRVSLFNDDVSGGTFDYYLHDLSGVAPYTSTANRVAGPISLSWSSTPGTALSYLTSAPVLSGTAFSDHNTLNWTASGTINGTGVGDTLYLLRRELVSPPGEAVSPTQYLTALTRDDNDPAIVQGLTYYYDIFSFMYFASGAEADPITPTDLVPDRIVAFNETFGTSNVVSLQAQFGSGVGREGGYTDTLCSYTSVANLQTIYLLGTDLSPSTPYYLFTTSASTASDVDTGRTATTDADGNVAFDLSASNVTRTYWLHSVQTTPAASRVGNAMALSWVSGGTVPAYLSGNPVLAVAPDNAAAQLSWTPPSSCDARSSFTYSLRRDTSSPPTTVIASGLTTTSYYDSPLSNGTTYFWRTRSRWFVFNIDTGTTNDSNIVSVAPSSAFGSRQIWGAIAL